MVELVVHKKNGDVICVKYPSPKIAEGPFQLKVKKEKEQILWAAVYDLGAVYLEYIDESYSSFLERLNCPKTCTPREIQITKNLLSHLEKTNPVLFDKYLEFIYKKIK